MMAHDGIFWRAEASGSVELAFRAYRFCLQHLKGGLYDRRYQVGYCLVCGYDSANQLDEAEELARHSAEDCILNLGEAECEDVGSARPTWYCFGCIRQVC